MDAVVTGDGAVFASYVSGKPGVAFGVDIARSYAVAIGKLRLDVRFLCLGGLAGRDRLSSALTASGLGCTGVSVLGLFRKSAIRFSISSGVRTPASISPLIREYSHFS